MKEKKLKEVLVWYKSNCSTCISVKTLLKEAGYEPLFFEYIHEPIEEEKLRWLIDKLGIKAEALVRKKEPIYKEKYAEKKMSDKQWIKAMIKYPVLIERPILIEGEKVIIGRPMERVIAFCKK